MPALEGLAARLRGLRGVLVDSNVFLDIASKDSQWADWSRNALAECTDLTVTYINPVIYAEVSVGFAGIEELDAALPREIYEREALPWEAAFLAGKCFAKYRSKGGPRTSLLPDFYIGAHAAIGNLALLTRDASRFQSYFPKLEILVPRKES